MPERAASLILDAFLDYNARFSDITRRARRRFERRDWKHDRVDAAARIDLYDVCIRETLGRLELLLEDRMRSRALWAAMRKTYESLIAHLDDRELTTTFFCSPSRRHFLTIGVAPAIEFIGLDLEPIARIVSRAALYLFDVAADLVETM